MDHGGLVFEVIIPGSFIPDIDLTDTYTKGDLEFLRAPVVLNNHVAITDMSAVAQPVVEEWSDTKWVGVAVTCRQGHSPIRPSALLRRLALATDKILLIISIPEIGYCGLAMDAEPEITHRKPWRQEFDNQTAYRNRSKHPVTRHL